MKVLVCGSRTWRDQRKIEARLRQLPRGSIVIHGQARGADTIAGTIAEALGFDVRAFPAEWRPLGRDGPVDYGAGKTRNLVMLDEQPELVLAFWDRRSTGTKHTIDAALERGIAVEVIE